MPWLNWSLKLHIKLRTIPFLISTHITHVYVQWMPYSFVWLYLIKCVFTCSILVDQIQFFFWSVSVVFGKYFVSTKIVKISKTVLPCFGDSVVGWSSRMPQSRAHIEIFHPHCGSMSQSQKILRIFFKIWVFMFLAA